MPETIQSEDRLRIETLRGISYLADYLDTTTIVSVIWMGAFASLIIGLFFEVIYSSIIPAVLAAYLGAIFALYGLLLRTRFKKRFTRKFNTVFLPQLTQSSDYDQMVVDLRNRLDKLLIELANREGELTKVKDQMREIEIETQRLKLERNREKHRLDSRSDAS